MNIYSRTNAYPHTMNKEKWEMREDEGEKKIVEVDFT